jgi:hypothetical protein
MLSSVRITELFDEGSYTVYDKDKCIPGLNIFVYLSGPPLKTGGNEFSPAGAECPYSKDSEEAAWWNNGRDFSIFVWWTNQTNILKDQLQDYRKWLAEFEKNIR